VSERPEFGTVEFYQAMADVLNADPVWAEKGKPLTCSMVYVYGPPIGRNFFLNFVEGHISEVAEIASPDARPAEFVITGTGDAWKAVLRAEVKPATAMATGKLKVKGKQTFLLKNMGAFSHILDVMTKIDPVYP
jgi:hypothetical protein